MLLCALALRFALRLQRSLFVFLSASRSGRGRVEDRADPAPGTPPLLYLRSAPKPPHSTHPPLLLAPAPQSDVPSAPFPQRVRPFFYESCSLAEAPEGAAEKPVRKITEYLTLPVHPPFPSGPLIIGFPSGPITFRHLAGGAGALHRGALRGDGGEGAAGVAAARAAQVRVEDTGGPDTGYVCARLCGVCACVCGCACGGCGFSSAERFERFACCALRFFRPSRIAAISAATSATAPPPSFPAAFLGHLTLFPSPVPTRTYPYLPTPLPTHPPTQG